MTARAPCGANKKAKLNKLIDKNKKTYIDDKLNSNDDKLKSSKNIEQQSINM